MKTLVIAEKPSVAADLARVLKVPKKGDLFENETHIITSAVGHLVELEMPEDINPEWKSWRLATLPIIPAKFTLKASPKTKDRFQLLKKLLNRQDVATAVNACDAGREGELIFAYIYQLAKAKVPVQRAWMQTMTADGIRAAFAALRPASEMVGLEAAARCRSESDWLIGLNGTRALTKRLGGVGKKVVTVGRVQTPTLAIVAARDTEIRNFQPRDYHRITATFQITAGTYEGTFQRPDFKKNTDEHDRADRLWHKPTAQTIATAAKNASTAEVSDEKKAATQASPRLYDLTSLQREANARFGLPARRTLQIAQALYERHKVITYPRTDSRALPEDYIPTCKQTLEKLEFADLAAHAKHALNSGYVRPNKRIFNNAQISDHFAIIPTGSPANNLDDIEAKIYDMIARRFVATFYPAAEFDVTTRTTTIPITPAIQAQFTPQIPNTKPTTLQTLTFKSEGKVLVAPGWLSVYGKNTLEDADETPNPKDKNAHQNTANKSLPPLSKADGQPPHAHPNNVQLHAETTKPPPHYTEATLLSAMESAGKLVDDEELAEAMKERGLGTPATRADIIEGLINTEYLERSPKRELLTTAKARNLLEFLNILKDENLTTPEMTGQWEYKLRQMEHGKYTRTDFMHEIENVTRDLIQKIKTYSEDDHESTRETDIPSPTDSQPLLETPRTYKSQDGRLIIYKTIAGRKISEDEIRQLLQNEELGPFDDFTSPRTGKTFSAKLRLAQDPKKPENKKIELDFGDKIDHTTITPFWTAANAKTQLVEGPAGYILRQPEKDGSYKELFKIGRTLCQKPITQTHAIQLAESGKTELIEGFISKKGRPFNAFLLRKDTRIAWEFPPREPKTGTTDDTSGKKTARSTKSTAAPINLATAKNLGPAEQFPKGTHLFKTETHYIVSLPPAPDGLPPEKPNFIQTIKLCGLDLPEDQITLLVNKGKTTLIPDMISKAGKKFSAYLTLSKDKKKAEFEFPPR